MEKSEVTTRGKVLLATVKGDVHDIGKNLVDIILSNNGFEVVNLGIKIPPEQLIQAVREHRPDLIGLSGLLVKSAQQMVTTAEDLARAGIQTPILVGGAALSRGFTEKRIWPAYGGAPVFYAKDAMNGLDLANRAMDPTQRQVLENELEARKLENSEAAAKTTVVEEAPDTKGFERSPYVKVLETTPQPPDFKRHVQKQIPLEQIWKYVNPLMLYTRHLGVKAKAARLFESAAKDPNIAKQLRSEDPKALSIWEKVEEVKATYRNLPVLQPTAVYRYFRAASQGNSLLIFADENSSKPAAQFKFERQRKGERLCLADYVNPLDGPTDSMAMFVTTVGRGVREEAAALKGSGEFLKSHILQALAIETAEAYAEWLHAYLRSTWGFADDPNMTMMERFQGRYRGKRFSFGYPACPNLEDQALLFELLAPHDIGVQLTDGYMMDPEASVSAVVFHHPDAKYFGVNGGSGDETPA